MDETERELQAMAAGERARLEQRAEGLREIAETISAFRAALIDAGPSLPHSLVDDLTREFAIGLFETRHELEPDDDE